MILMLHRLCLGVGQNTPIATRSAPHVVQNAFANARVFGLVGPRPRNFRQGSEALLVYDLTDGQMNGE